MKSIDFLEHGGATGASPFAIRVNGEIISLPDPRSKHYQWVLLALHIGHVPGIPFGIPDWQRRLAFEHWCAAWDLPDIANAKRLAYLVDHYRPAISNDLRVYANTDLGDLWRARRWTLLLDVIDRLPAHSWYSSSVAMDEEHARMMAEALEARSGDAVDERGPALTTWTPEVSMLTNVLDAVRGVQHAVYAAQHGKKAGEPPKPAPRPITALERAMKTASFNRRKAAHDALVARILPHKKSVKA